MSNEIDEVVEKKKTTSKKSILPTRATLVEIRPIEVKKWHGKKGEESFTRPKKLQALVDGVTMKYSTGLTEEEVKALKEEKKVNYDLSDNYNSNEPHPFWDSTLAVLKLENSTMFLDINQPLNYIKVKIAKASRFVANSLAEYEAGDFPDATHVIFDEVEQSEILATKVEIKNSAIIEASKLTSDRKIQLILILGGKNLKGHSDSFVAIELDKVITKDAELFLRHLKMDAKETALHALVLEAIQKNVLRKDGHKILYMDSVLGSDETDVVKYLNEDLNQDLKLAIISKVN